MSSQEEHLILFKVADEYFGFSVVDVKEVVDIAPFTRLPNAPPIFLGIMNLRGRILKVVNLSRCLGLPSLTGDKSSQRIAVLNEPDMDIGLIVDQVSQIQRVSEKDLEDVPTLKVGESKSPFLRKIAKVDGHVVNVLDRSKLVASINAAMGAI